MCVDVYKRTGDVSITQDEWLFQTSFQTTWGKDRRIACLNKVDSEFYPLYYRNQEHIYP